LHWPPGIRHKHKKGILAVDLPGHGKSTGKPEATIAAYAKVLFEFMDILGIERAVLCGHSMGSAIAQRMSLDHPERVEGLIQIGAGAKLGVHPKLIKAASRADTYPQAVEQILAWSFSQQADQKLVRLAGKRMNELSPDILKADFEACNNFDIRAEVAEIKQPTLIICGEDDQMTPVKFSEYLAEKIRNSKLEFIPSAGHMVMLEKPEPVARLIDDFISELPQSRRI